MLFATQPIARLLSPIRKEDGNKNLILFGREKEQNGPLSFHNFLVLEFGSQLTAGEALGKKQERLAVPVRQVRSDNLQLCRANSTKPIRFDFELRKLLFQSDEIVGAAATDFKKSDSLLPKAA